MLIICRRQSWPENAAAVVAFSELFFYEYIRFVTQAEDVTKDVSQLQAGSARDSMARDRKHDVSAASTGCLQNVT